LDDNQGQLTRLLDLYLAGDFVREVLTERRTRLEENISNLRKEHSDISSHLNQLVVSDRQMEEN